MKKIILLLCLAYIYGSCKKHSETEPQRMQENVWIEENGHPWDKYTVVASNNKIAYYEYRPSDLMIVTDRGVSRIYEGAPKICDPRLYYLNDTLFVAGGYTGSVNQKHYNDILYKIKLSEAAP